MGMNKDAVQNERQPRNTATIRPETLRDMEHGRAIREAAVAVGVFGPPVLLSPRYGSGMLNQYSSQLIQHSQLANPMQLTNGLPCLSNNNNNILMDNNNSLGKLSGFASYSKLNGSKNSDVMSHGNSDVEKSFNSDTISSTSSSSPAAHGNENDDDSIDVTNSEDQQVQKCETSISENDLSAPHIFSSSFYCHPHETVYETSARLLFMAVKWAKNLPSFSSLPFKDQVVLLEESWSDLFLLNAIQWCIPLEPNSCTLFSVNEHVNNTAEDAKKDIAFDVRTLWNVFCKFKSVLVDPAEFACLKAIVLFRPETKGLKDPPQIENLQDQAHVMLSQHTRTQFPAQVARFGRLLLTIPLLRTLNSHKIEQIFFQRTIGNTPMEKVLCDMYKN
ncbi:NR2E3 family protein [Megaselia abdita]